MSSLRDYLTKEVCSWEQIGHHSLLQRFVLRNGKEYTPGKRIGRRGAAKQCFRNSHLAVARRPSADGWLYVEGFAIHREYPILAFHHAWITVDGDTAMDLTLDAAQYDYMGVAFDKQTLMEETARTEFYGLLDMGLGLNARFIFGIDPDLKAVVEAIKPNARFQNLREQTEARS
jgi:hypothetical protein